MCEILTEDTPYPYCSWLPTAIAVHPEGRPKKRLRESHSFEHERRQTSLSSPWDSEWSFITVKACSIYPMAFVLSVSVFRDKLIVQIVRSQRENFSTEKEPCCKLERRIVCQNLDK